MVRRSGRVVDNEPVVALVGGADRLDEARLASAASRSSARRADAAEVQAATGYAVGSVPSVRSCPELRCFVDDALLAHDVVWVGAGTPRHVFASEPHALVAAARAEVATIRVTG